MPVLDLMLADQEWRAFYCDGIHFSGAYKAHHKRFVFEKENNIYFNVFFIC